MQVLFLRGIMGFIKSLKNDMCLLSEALYVNPSFLFTLNKVQIYN